MEPHLQSLQCRHLKTPGPLLLQSAPVPMEHTICEHPGIMATTRFILAQKSAKEIIIAQQYQFHEELYMKHIKVMLVKRLVVSEFFYTYVDMDNLQNEQRYADTTVRSCLLQYVPLPNTVGVCAPWVLNRPTILINIHKSNVRLAMLLVPTNTIN